MKKHEFIFSMIANFIYGSYTKNSNQMRLDALSQFSLVKESYMSTQVLRVPQDDDFELRYKQRRAAQLASLSATQTLLEGIRPTYDPYVSAALNIAAQHYFRRRSKEFKPQEVVPHVLHREADLVKLTWTHELGSEVTFCIRPDGNYVRISFRGGPRLQTQLVTEAFRLVVKPLGYIGFEPTGRGSGLHGKFSLRTK